jgi:DNA-binding IclR family transcriptional regulator
VAYRIGTRHALDRGAAGRAILAARRGQDGYVATDGELQSGAHGIAAPLVGVAGLEASLGVVSMVELDASSVGPQVQAAAREIASLLR